MSTMKIWTPELSTSSTTTTARSSTVELALPEFRHARVELDRLEVRNEKQTGDGSLTLTGHAAVFDQETELFDIGWLRLREKIRPGAFADVLASDPDVHLTVGHDFDKSMARTGVDGVGGLELSEDDTGLRVFARIDPELSFVKDLAIQLRSGVVDQMSFMFDIGEQVTTIDQDDDGNEDELREIVSVSNLYDVTVVARGAYHQTDASLRQAIENVHRGRRSTAGPPNSSQPPLGETDVDTRGVESDTNRERARLKAEIALTLGGATNGHGSTTQGGARGA